VEEIERKATGRAGGTYVAATGPVAVCSRFDV
jgi:hypothetical protein